MQKKLEGTMENYFGLICSNDGPLMTYPSLEDISLLWYTTPCNFLEGIQLADINYFWKVRTGYASRTHIYGNLLS